MTEKDYEAFVARVEATVAEEDRIYYEKLQSLNKRKREKSKKMREMGLKPYAGQRKAASPSTICFNCKNSCPNPIKGIGCEWSENLKPVPGWEAIREDIRPNIIGRTPLVSYVVVSCPKFVEG